jgi:uncharacterized protein (TIGR03118 family)
MSARFVLRAPPLLCVALLVACAEDRGVSPFAPAAPMFSTVAQTANSQFYQQHNIVSDGAVPADLVDTALVNAWGLVSSGTSPFWVADNGTGLSTLYNGNTGAKVPLTVTVPGAPTGVVFNGGTGFVVTHGSARGQARFIFASEDGTISGWNPAVRPTQAVVGVDNSGSGAVYKGLAVASTSNGDLLYATNFRAGTVDVFDTLFHSFTTSGGFTDPDLPAGYAPFGIRNLGGTIYVTYALQDAAKHDDVAGIGHGFVNAFDTDGHLLRRVASRARLDSPWGLAIAPTDFGQFTGDLLVGNFGDGHINAFDLDRTRGPGESQQRGQLHSADGQPITIDGLWAIAFGNGAAAGPRNELFFTAGPFGEQHGLFGKLVATPSPAP